MIHRLSPHRPPFGQFELNRESPQARGLVAWWPTLGSRGANVLRDFGGRGLDGAFPGGAANPSWVGDWQLGSALKFDGTDYAVASGTMGGEGAATVAAWVYFDIMQACKIWGQTTNVPATALDLYLGVYVVGAQNQFYYYLSDPAGWLYAYTGNLAQVGIWQHVVGVWPGGASMSIFVNGISQSLTTLTGGTPGIGTTGSWQIGRNLQTGGIEYLAGRITDLRIHNVALSPAVIHQMAHDKKWELYKPLRRVWAVKLPAGWQSVFGGRGMSPIGSAVIRPGVVM